MQPTQQLQTLLRDAASLVTWIALGQAFVYLLYTAFSLEAEAASNGGRSVDRSSCDCTCFDGKFKAGYDVSGYKSVYFNLDEQLPQIVAVSALYFTLAILAVRTLMTHVLYWRVRWSMALLATAAFYPNFYSYWMLFNYNNDRFYRLLPAQLFYAATEGVMSCILIALADSRIDAHPVLLWTLFGFAGVHAVKNGLDQPFPRLGVRLMGAIDWAVLLVVAFMLLKRVGAPCVDFFDTCVTVAKSFRRDGALPAVLDSGNGGGSAYCGGGTATLIEQQQPNCSQLYSAKAAWRDFAKTCACVAGSLLVLAWLDL